jgi:hypothetical protein
VRLISAVPEVVLVFILAIVWVALPNRPVRAAAPVIGTVAAKGSFRLDNATVNGNATLFEGASVETTTATSSMELIGGARLSLAPLSKGKFYGDKVVLEKGSSEVEKAAGLKIEARGLTIQPETGRASARILLLGSNRVDVEAMTGSFRVLNSRGILIANLAAGRALELDPQPPQAAQTKLSGCLVFRNGRYVITDETTNVTIEVGGLGLDKEKGNRVELTGAMDPTMTPVSDASQFVRVASVKHLAKGCAGTAAAGAGGAGAPKPVGAGAGIGMSGTTIAIVGGVAAAGLVGGLAAAGKFSSSSGTVSQ